MEDGHLFAEVGGKDPQQLGREHDLRHQHQGRPAPGEELLNQADVDLSLAAARHAVEQGGGGLVRPGQNVQSLQGRPLLPVELRGRSWRDILQRSPAEHLLPFQCEDAALLQRL